MMNRRRIIDSDDDDDDELKHGIHETKKDIDSEIMIIEDKENQWIDCRDSKTMTIHERYNYYS